MTEETKQQPPVTNSIPPEIKSEDSLNKEEKKEKKELKLAEPPTGTLHLRTAQQFVRKDNKNVFIVAPTWTTKALKVLSPYFRGRSFNILDNDGKVVDTITIGENLTLLEAYQLAQSDMKNTNGKIDFSKFPGIPTAAIYSLLDLIGHCAIVAADLANGKGGYTTAYKKFSEPMPIIVASCAYRQFQQKHNDGRIYLRDGDGKEKPSPFPKGLLDSFIYDSVGDTAKPIIPANIGADPKVMFLNEPRTLDIEGYAQDIAEKFVLIGVGANQLGKEAKSAVNYRFLNGGTGYFTAGLVFPEDPSKKINRGPLKVAEQKHEQQKDVYKRAQEICNKEKEQGEAKANEKLAAAQQEYVKQTERYKKSEEICNKEKEQAEATANEKLAALQKEYKEQTALFEKAKEVYESEKEQDEPKASEKLAAARQEYEKQTELYKQAQETCKDEIERVRTKAKETFDAAKKEYDKVRDVADRAQREVSKAHLTEYMLYGIARGIERLFDEHRPSQITAIELPHYESVIRINPAIDKAKKEVERVCKNRKIELIWGSADALEPSPGRITVVPSLGDTQSPFGNEWRVKKEGKLTDRSPSVDPMIASALSDPDKFSAVLNRQMQTVLVPSRASLVYEFPKESQGFFKDLLSFGPVVSNRPSFSISYREDKGIILKFASKTERGEFLKKAGQKDIEEKYRSRSSVNKTPYPDLSDETQLIYPAFTPQGTQEIAMNLFGGHPSFLSTIFPPDDEINEVVYSNTGQINRTYGKTFINRQPTNSAPLKQGWVEKRQLQKPIIYLTPEAIKLLREGGSIMINGRGIFYCPISTKGLKLDEQLTLSPSSSPSSTDTSLSSSATGIVKQPPLNPDAPPPSSPSSSSSASPSSSHTNIHEQLLSGSQASSSLNSEPLPITQKQHSSPSLVPPPSVAFTTISNPGKTQNEEEVLEPPASSGLLLLE